MFWGHVSLILIVCLFSSPFSLNLTRKHEKVIPGQSRPLYQYSLDRKRPLHTYTCEQNAQILLRLDRERQKKYGSSGRLSVSFALLFIDRGWKLREILIYNRAAFHQPVEYRSKPKGKAQQWSPLGRIQCEQPDVRVS